jgi:hypothetical protein
MDADEIARIDDALLTAIAEAKAVVKIRGVGPQFREIVRQARVRRNQARTYHSSLPLRRVA